MKNARPRGRATVAAELRRALGDTAQWAPLLRGLYGTPEFQAAAEDYERALGEALAQRPAVRGTAGQALLAAVAGPADDAAWRDAVAGALGLKETSAEAIRSEAARWAEPVSGVGVRDLLRVFAVAVTHPEPLPEFTTPSADTPEHRTWLRERGIPGGAGVAPLLGTLLRKYRELTDATVADLGRFLEAAVSRPAGLPLCEAARRAGRVGRHVGLPRRAVQDRDLR